MPMFSTVLMMLHYTLQIYANHGKRHHSDWHKRVIVTSETIFIKLIQYIFLTFIACYGRIGYFCLHEICTLLRIESSGSKNKGPPKKTKICLNISVLILKKQPFCEYNSDVRKFQGPKIFKSGALVFAISTCHEKC